MNICFVVHRYAPFPGGSEYYVQQMAEECVRRNISVTVFAGEHKGDLNGVIVTSDVNVLLQKFDLIVVHGGDVGVQNFVLQNANQIPSPILYLLVKPSESLVCLQALKDVAKIGCSTQEDWDHVKKWNVESKSVKVIHGISPLECLGAKTFREKYGIPKDVNMFLSCGGYWPNKKMKELAKAFQEANLPNSILVTTGYDNRFGLMPHASEKVIPLMVDDPRDVKNAIVDADCYIMNSDAEGFGLVILESMLNKTPWISRDIAGAKMLNKYGITYDTEDQLVEILKSFHRDEEMISKGYSFVTENHLIKNTVDDILVNFRDSNHINML